MYDQENKADESVRFCNFLAGQEVAQKDSENLFNSINGNRENILSEFNKLFWK